MDCRRTLLAKEKQATRLRDSLEAEHRVFPMSDRAGTTSSADNDLLELALEWPDYKLETKRMLRSHGLAVNGKVFVFADSTRIVIKLPAYRAAELVSKGIGVPYQSGTRVMRQWVALQTCGEENWKVYVREALDFVSRDALPAE